MGKEKYKISFEITPEEAKNNVLKLLQTLEVNGVIGASRSFGILDPVSEKEKEFSCFFDGDGNHRLENIKIEKIELIEDIEERQFGYENKIKYYLNKRTNEISIPQISKPISITLLKAILKNIEDKQ